MNEAKDAIILLQSQEQENRMQKVEARFFIQMLKAKSLLVDSIAGANVILRLMQEYGWRGTAIIPPNVQNQDQITILLEGAHQDETNHQDGAQRSRRLRSRIVHY